MVICMQCGAQNRKGDKHCNSCGAAMPHFEVTPTVKVETVTGRFKLFHDAVENVKQGNLSVEDFYDFLHQQYEILLEKRNDIEASINESNYMESAGDEVSQGVQGMDHFEAGIQELSLFCEDGEFVHLESGIDLIRMGNDFINDAMRINRVSRKELEEQWGVM